MVRWICCALLMLAGCQYPRLQPSAPLDIQADQEAGIEPPRVIPRGLRYPVQIGDAARTYVVVQDPLGLPVGHGGTVYRNDRPVGKVQLSATRDGPWVAADVTAGEARAGDTWEPDP